jgi:molecular chaperone DnaK (HSP70)
LKDVIEKKYNISLTNYPNAHKRIEEICKKAIKNLRNVSSSRIVLNKLFEFDGKYINLNYLLERSKLAELEKAYDSNILTRQRRIL